MRNSMILTLVAALLLMAAPAAAVPFGHFDGTRDATNSLTGVVGLVGWTLDASGVRWVDVYVDGQPVGRALQGLGRPGVTAMFPGFPNSALPGFGFYLDTTHYFNGLHRVEVLVTSVDGTQRFLNPRVYEFMNTTHLLDPFGEIQFPRKHATLGGVCDLEDPLRRYSVIEGHVLDVGVERGHHGEDPDQGDPPGDSGVGYVELLIDGVIFANTKTDCVFSAATGGFTNCYGLASPEIEKRYPTVPDAPHARFRFVVDVGALLAMGVTPGSHVFTIRAGDITGQVANVDENVYRLTCDEFEGNEPSFGVVANPSPVDIYHGTITVTGWALDFEGVAFIEVFADGKLVGTATHGIPRPFIASRYPGYPDSAGPGYTFLFDTTVVADGWVDIIVRVTDEAGRRTIIGERTIRVDNLVDD